MAGPTIRGHKAQLRLFKDGQPVDALDLLSFDFNQDADFHRSEFLGNPIPEGDQSEKGWNGSMEMEVRNAKIDDLIDALIGDNLAGIGVSEYNITYSENYSDGTSKSWLYFDIQCKLSGSAKGLSSKITRKLDWQASGRLPVK